MADLITHGENVLGEEHPDTATNLNDLALLDYAQGRYEQAEPFLQRALAIRENVLGAEHPDTAQSLNNLAALYREQGRYEQAEEMEMCASIIKAKYSQPNSEDQNSE